MEIGPGNDCYHKAVTSSLKSGIVLDKVKYPHIELGPPPKNV